MTPREAIAKAIEIVGGPSKVAAAFGIHPQAVSQWKKKSPANRAIALEHLTEGVITRTQLRPDLYPHDPKQPLVTGASPEVPSRRVG